MQNFFSRQMFLITVVLIITTCIVCICTLSGFRHETEKFKTMLLTMLLVLLICYFIGDAIMLTLEALLITCWRRLREGEPRFPPGITRPHSYSATLRQRLLSLKSNYHLPWKHRDEQLNKFYRALKSELFTFLAYFIVLLVLVGQTRDQLIYYNTNSKSMMLENQAIGDMGLTDVYRLQDVNKYIRETLIDGFHKGIDYRGQPISEPGWLNYEMGKLVGVIRLRQLRFDDNSKRYLPGWKEPYVRYHYLRKYWRIYGPWLPLDYNDHDTLERSRELKSSSYNKQPRSNDDVLDEQDEDKELVFDLSGELHRYSQYGGYETVLARDRNNSLTVAQFLERYNWLSLQTAALFIDFTLFNVDANIFTVVSLLLEQTPFGDIIVTLQVHSCKLLLDLNGLTFGELAVLALYLLVLIQFIIELCVRLYQQSCRQFNGWNFVDVLIVLLNISIVPVVCWRERRVMHLLEQVGETSKLRFVDFRGPAQLDYLLVVLIGFLICLSTVRLWRIMQFARVFRLFTTTLSLVKWPMVSSVLFITVVLFSFGISSCIINGSQSESFSQPMKSLRAGMSVAIGVGNDMGPLDLSYGGITLGMLQYTILMVSVAVVLVNMFITLIIDYFTIATGLINQEKTKRINFFEFLTVEYGWAWRCLQRIGKCCCRWRQSKRTIKQRMETALGNLENKPRKTEDEEYGMSEEADNENESVAAIKQDRHMLRLQQLADILRTQMELIDRELMLLDLEQDWDEEAVIGGGRSTNTSRWISKNGKLKRVPWKRRWKALYIASAA